MNSFIFERVIQMIVGEQSYSAASSPLTVSKQLVQRSLVSIQELQSKLSSIQTIFNDSLKSFFHSLLIGGIVRT